MKFDLPTPEFNVTRYSFKSICDRICNLVVVDRGLECVKTSVKVRLCSHERMDGDNLQSPKLR
jgi:hypothetical protein